MKRIVFSVLITGLLLYCGSLAATRVEPYRTPTEDRGLALVGAKIYPSPTEDPITNGVVLIKDGKIVDVGKSGKIRIPPDFEKINVSGATLTAGFWNCHVHFAENKWYKAASIPADELSQQLQDMLTRYGFTTVFDTGSPLENTKALRQRIESKDVPGPKIFTTGDIIYPKGGAPPAMLLNAFGVIPGYVPVEVSDPQQGVEAVRQKLANGADAIKIYASTWGVMKPATIPLEVVRAIAAETHKQGKLLLAHPSNSDGLNVSIDGGVDVILHTAPSAGNWDQTLIAKMKAKNISLVPTLKLFHYEGRHARASQVAPTVDMVVSQLRAYAQVGGTILFGTDVGYMDDYDPTEEYVLMARAGMSFRQILTSLTTAPAERFGASAQTGRIAPGFDAEINLLEGDPAADVRAFSRVRFSIRSGRLIYSRPAS